VTKPRKTIDVDHTGMGGIVRVPINESGREIDGLPVDYVRYAAHVLAQREYGRGGECRSIRLDSRTNHCFIHQAFIGRRLPDGCTSGRNVYIYT